MKMKKISWYLNCRNGGNTLEGIVEVPENATEDEIDLAAKDEAFSMIDWGWTPTAKLKKLASLKKNDDE